MEGRLADQTLRRIDGARGHLKMLKPSELTLEGFVVRSFEVLVWIDLD